MHDDTTGDDVKKHVSAARLSELDHTPVAQHSPASLGPGWMDSPRSHLLPLLAAAAAAAAAVVSAGVALAAHRLLQTRRLEREIARLDAALEHAEQQRAAERTGRIRAQRELRKTLGGTDAGNVGDTAYPMTPIGVIRSCFSTRNGTPRQPLLVPLAKAHLVLSPGGVPHEALDGLAMYSHCWLLYVFHENTDLPRLWSKPAHRDLRAKVRVPRLDGGKMGIFATRTPHRPCPIGLSVAKIEGVSGGTVILSGVDLVDGTPVLDVKPYLTYCDAVVDAVTPTWVKAGGPDDVLAIACVDCTETFKQELTTCWECMGKQSLYSSPQEFQLLLEQVLSRDIRSLCQRQRPHHAAMNDLDLEYRAPEVEDGPGNASHMKSGKPQGEEVTYYLVLEGIRVAYTVNHGQVLVTGANLTPELERRTKT